MESFDLIFCMWGSVSYRLYMKMTSFEIFLKSMFFGAKLPIADTVFCVIKRDRSSFLYPLIVDFSISEISVTMFSVAELAFLLDELRKLIRNNREKVSTSKKLILKLIFILVLIVCRPGFNSYWIFFSRNGGEAKCFCLPWPLNFTTAFLLALFGENEECHSKITSKRAFILWWLAYFCW